MPYLSYITSKFSILSSGQKSTLVVLIAVLILIAILFIWMLLLHVRMKNMLVGKNLKNLEETFVNIRNDLKSISQFKQKSEIAFNNIDSRLRKSIQGVETIRFNPFKGTGSGGNQSFSTAMINENGDGFILSSLYSRDRISIFSKPVKNFIAEFELTDEEKNALDKAKQKIAG